MTVRYFLDTNILLYAAMTKLREPVKAPLAAALVAQDGFGVSGQVLQEFFVNAVRKSRHPMPVAQAMAWIGRLSAQPCVPFDAPLVTTAMRISERYRIDYWDGAIIAADEALGAGVLYTEDLNDGQFYGSVRAVNPFRAT